MKLTEIELNSIQSLLIKRPKQTGITKTLRKLNIEFSIGYIVNRTIELSESDYQLLEKLYTRETKCSYLKTRNKNCDRVKRLETSVSEKAGGRPVGYDQINCSAVKKPIQLISGLLEAGNHPGVTNLLSINLLDLTVLEKVIIVENLTMMQYTHEWVALLPEDWQDALIVYRGHNRDAAAVIELVKKLKPTAKIGVYSDYDIAGVSIVQSYSKIRDVYFFYPNDWAEISTSQGGNKPSTFEKQLTRGYLEPKDPELNKHYKFIVSKNIALMQEGFRYINGLSCDLIHSQHIH